MYAAYLASLSSSNNTTANPNQNASPFSLLASHFQKQQLPFMQPPHQQQQQQQDQSTSTFLAAMSAMAAAAASQGGSGADANAAASLLPQLFNNVFIQQQQQQQQLQQQQQKLGLDCMAVASQLLSPPNTQQTSPQTPLLHKIYGINKN